jgi:hypothetical protein
MKLELSTFTWLAFFAASGLWLWSVRLTREADTRQDWNWKNIPLSFFGLAWISFGITFISRFIFLLYDPEFFRATQFPLWRMPAATFTWTWISLTLFWLCFTGGYLAIMRLSPHRPLILEKLDLLAAPASLLTLDILVVCCSILIILSGREIVPRALSTPLGILGGFYAIAATTVWFNAFQGRPAGLRKFLYLIPGILVYLYSPYRALIFAVILCVLVPVLKTRRRLSLTSFLLAMLVLLLVATIVNDYRRSAMKPEHDRRHDASLSDETWGSKEHRTQPSWGRIIDRFHGIDSMALNTHFVPSYFPYSHLNIFSDLLWRIIPRSLMDKKSEVHRGQKFSVTIWAMGERGLTKRDEANISPSMCADLYQIDGLPLVVVGAAFYGLLVGLLESWQRRGTPLNSCILLALFGMPVALGIEQEFNFAAATLVQMIIGLLCFLLFLPVLAPAYLPRKSAHMKNRDEIN